MNIYTPHKACFCQICLTTHGMLLLSSTVICAHYGMSFVLTLVVVKPFRQRTISKRNSTRSDTIKQTITEL